MLANSTFLIAGTFIRKKQNLYEEIRTQRTSAPSLDIYALVRVTKNAVPKSLIISNASVKLMNINFSLTVMHRFSNYFNALELRSHYIIIDKL